MSLEINIPDVQLKMIPVIFKIQWAGTFQRERPKNWSLLLALVSQADLKCSPSIRITRKQLASIAKVKNLNTQISGKVPGSDFIPLELLR